MNRLVLPTILVGVLTVLQPSEALAASIHFTPPLHAVTLGQTFTVDIVVSGLEGATPAEIVSAFDLKVFYDAAILNAVDLTFGLELGDPTLFESFAFSDLSIPGEVRFFALSLLSDAALDSLQSDSVTLATIGFDAIDVGTSALTFVADGIHGVVGRDGLRLPLDVGGGSVDVAVGEPPAWFLLTLGVAALICGARRARRRSAESGQQRPAPPLYGPELIRW